MTHEEQQELFEERAGIREFCGGLDREEAERLAREDVQKALFDSEVLSVVRMYREKGGKAVRSFLLQVEKHRGSQAAERLRGAALSHLGVGGETR